jgi:hypothetical protein
MLLLLLVGGQGIASGFRDAIGLAWRLAILCSSKTALNHEAILAAWYKERKQQLDKSLAATVRNGDMVNTKSSLQGFFRDWALWSMQLIPSWKHWLERGPRAEGPIWYTHEAGMPFLPGMKGGVCFAQTYCVSLSNTSADAHVSPTVQFTDDAIFAPDKRSLFQLVVLLPDFDALAKTLTQFDELNPSHTTSALFSYSEATLFIPRTSIHDSSTTHIPDAIADRVYRTATAEEFAQSNLCRGRPLPRGYNEDLMWESMAGKQFVVMRPDRFVFAACDTVAELDVAVRNVERMFV